MNKWKLIIGVVLLIGLGVAMGVLGSIYYLKSRHVVIQIDPPKARHEFFMKGLCQELDLSESQNAKISQIIDKLEKRAHQMIETHREQIRNDFRRSIAEIRAELNPEQQAKLDALVDEFRKRKKLATP